MKKEKKSRVYTYNGWQAREDRGDFERLDDARTIIAKERTCPTGIKPTLREMVQDIVDHLLTTMTAEDLAEAYADKHAEERRLRQEAAQERMQQQMLDELEAAKARVARLSKELGVQDD